MWSDLEGDRSDLALSVEDGRTTASGEAVRTHSSIHSSQDDEASLEFPTNLADLCWRSAGSEDALTAWFPVADGKMLNAAACMFTNTKDHHFIIDRHPVHHQVCLPFCPSFQGHFKACARMSEDPPSQSVGARTD